MIKDPKKNQYIWAVPKYHYSHVWQLIWEKYILIIRRKRSDLRPFWLGVDIYSIVDVY